MWPQQDSDGADTAEQGFDKVADTLNVDNSGDDVVQDESHAIR